MKTFVEVKTGTATAAFDVDDAVGAGPERVSRKDGVVVARLSETLDEALAEARPAAEAVVNSFRALSPDSVAIEFGLRLDAQAGAVFAKAGVGAHFTITLQWDRGSEEHAIGRSEAETTDP